MITSWKFWFPKRSKVAISYMFKITLFFILFFLLRAFISSPIDEVVHIDNQSLGETLLSPQPASNLFSKCLFYVTLPLRYVFYWTIPDVRRQGSEHRSLQSVLISSLWLGIFSYAIVVILSMISSYFQMEDSLVGFTVGAWAVSYPALWSSIVLAKKGFGQIALYNAIGSNTFSNFLGLGIPWLLYSTSTTMQGIQEQGLAFSNISLLVMIVCIYLLIACSSFTLSSW